MKITIQVFALSLVAVSLTLNSCMSASSDKTGPRAHRVPSSVGGINFQPILGSAYNELTDDPSILTAESWVIPNGFTQSVLSDDSRLKIYQGNDRPSSNVANESGAFAGRYLFRTHETYPHNDLHLDGSHGGAISVIDLQGDTTRLLATRSDWEVLDALVWTPWGTLLFAEKTDEPKFRDSEAPRAKRGLVYEMKLNSSDPLVVEGVKPLVALGALRHGGLKFDEQGNLYLTNANRNSYIYKFVPKVPGDLSKGKLYALAVKKGQTGKAKWVPLNMAQAKVDAHKAAKAANATPYCTPEDIERFGQMLYVAAKCEPRIGGKDGAGVVLAISLKDKPEVSYFVEAGKNVPIENRKMGATGFFRPNDLAVDALGRLWIGEDTSPGDLWVAETQVDESGYSIKVSLFASLKDRDGRPRGIFFGEDANSVIVNVHDSVTKSDKTTVISKAE